MQAVILAAGRGKRLHPITATRTKAMAPVLSKPIIERVMDTLIENGIQAFIVVISPTDEEITAYFEHVSQINADVIIIPQPEPLGMGDALMQTAPHIYNDFVLSACDNLVEPVEIKHMLATWAEEKPNAILTTLQVRPEEIIRMGIVEISEDQVIRIIEKPSLEIAPSNIGSVPLYMFFHRFVDYLAEIKPSPRGEYELQDAIQMLIDRDGSVRAFQLSGRRDLTTPDDLLAINLQYLRNAKPKTAIILEDVGGKTRFTSPVHIEKDVTIGSNCVIGPNVFIEHGCRIGDDVCLENVLILRNRNVPDGSIERDKVIW